MNIDSAAKADINHETKRVTLNLSKREREEDRKLTILRYSWALLLKQLELDGQVLLRVLAEVVDHLHAFGREVVDVVVERFVGQ